jgi:hypothetical protein
MSFDHRGCSLKWIIVHVLESGNKIAMIGHQRLCRAKKAEWLCKGLHCGGRSEKHNGEPMLSP